MIWLSRELNRRKIFVELQCATCTVVRHARKFDRGHFWRTNSKYYSDQSATAIPVIEKITKNVNLLLRFAPFF